MLIVKHATGNILLHCNQIKPATKSEALKILQLPKTIPPCEKLALVTGIVH